MGSSKTTGARKHQKTCLEIVLYSKIDFELASKQKCPHKEESLFLKFPFFCIPSEQSNWVSCHAPLFWLQEKNFFVLITRKSRGKNFFCAGWVFVHCNNSGGSVSAQWWVYSSPTILRLSWRWNITSSVYPHCCISTRYPFPLTLKKVLHCAGTGR